MAWISLCREKFPLVSHNGRLLAVGDGIKVPKEAQCQPGLTYLHSPSNNQSKPESFVGHHFGCIAFIAEKANKFKGILQVAQLHEAVDHLELPTDDKAPKSPGGSVVSRMLSLAIVIAKHQGQPLLLVLDALFSTAVAFHAVFQNLQEDGSPWVHVITRAKSNYVAYTGAGRHKKDRVKLWDIFSDPGLFSEHPHPLHPTRSVRLCQRDLYWGSGNFLLRLVWVIDGNSQFVLMSSDTLLGALEILKFYGLRGQIELNFRVLKHIIGGFCYRFWSTYCRLAYTRQALDTVSPAKKNIILKKSQLKLTAIERFVNLAIIAQGILGHIALSHTQWVWDTHHASSWLRSYSSAIPSDEVVQRSLQSQFLTLFSLQTVKDWVGLGGLPKLPGKGPKVRAGNTLRHFLSS